MTAQAKKTVSSATFDADTVRQDFPALHQEVHGKPLVYLDSAATALKPRSVIDAVVEVYATDCANIHRAVHLLSQRATLKFEQARKTVQRFISAQAPEEIVFTRGTTESINLISQSYARPRLKVGDEIVVSGLEHHSNIVPWQLVCEQTGAMLSWVPVEPDGSVSLERFAKTLSKRTRIVAISHVSNALGTVLPVAEITRIAHDLGAVVVVDGAQAAPHLTIDVGALGCDFYAFSGHKLYGPSGIGVLWGKRELLEAMPPYQGGGDMIRSVEFAHTSYNDVPYKFEAGTPHIAGAIGLAAAIEYVERLGLSALEKYESDLLDYGSAVLAAVPGLRLVGTAPHKVAVLAFVLDCAHPHDIGTIVDMEGVAIRTGHHCAQPLLGQFGLPATARASLGVYNTKADIDRLAEALAKVRALFA